MDPSCVRDAGTPVRGNVLVIVLIGALAVGLSFAASPDWRGAFGAALALLMLAIALSDMRHFIVPDALSASAFVLGLIFAGSVRRCAARRGDLDVPVARRGGGAAVAGADAAL